MGFLTLVTKNGDEVFGEERMRWSMRRGVGLEVLLLERRIPRRGTGNKATRSFC